MDQLGFAVCHQMSARSLHYGGQKLPVCARDTGLFLCFAITFIALLVAYRGRGRAYPSWKMIVALAALLLPAFLDAVTSYAGLRSSTNAIRIVTGALAGTGLAALLFPLASGLLFRGEEESVVLARWWQYPMLLGLPAALSLALWPDWPGAFWFWALLLCLSILFTVVVLNLTLLSLIVSRARDLMPRAWALLPFAAAMALVEIAAANRLHWLVNRFL